MSEFIDYLKDQLGSIYVWGAQGENVLAQPNPREWIYDMEKKSNSSAATIERNTERAYALFCKRKAEGMNPIRAYDCSGLVVKFLLDKGLIAYDMTAQYIYNKCDVKLDSPEQTGDFVFHYSTDSKKITHIGVFIGNGKVIEAKGRDYGVVETDLSAYAWNRAGRMTSLAPYLVDYPTEPLPLDITKPVHSGDAYKAMQMALNLLGYTDNDGCLLVEDGKWGKRSRQAYDKCVAANLGTVSFDGTLHIEGVCDKQMTLKEE